MSAARKRKKAAKGSPSYIGRYERMSDKRYDRDPTFQIGQMMLPAPIKYSRCKVCDGRPHHSPWLDGIW